MTVSALSVKRALIGIAFPADRKTLLAELRKGGAPLEITDAITQLPDGRYRSSDELCQSLMRTTDAGRSMSDRSPG